MSTSGQTGKITISKEPRKFDWVSRYSVFSEGKKLGEVYKPMYTRYWRYVIDGEIFPSGLYRTRKATVDGLVKEVTENKLVRKPPGRAATSTGKEKK